MAGGCNRLTPDFSQMFAHSRDWLWHQGDSYSRWRLRLTSPDLSELSINCYDAFRWKDSCSWAYVFLHYIPPHILWSKCWNIPIIPLMFLAYRWSWRTQGQITTHCMSHHPTTTCWKANEYLNVQMFLQPLKRQGKHFASVKTTLQRLWHKLESCPLLSLSLALKLTMDQRVGIQAWASQWKSSTDLHRRWLDPSTSKSLHLLYGKIDGWRLKNWHWIPMPHWRSRQAALAMAENTDKMYKEHEWSGLHDSNIFRSVLVVQLYMK